MVPIERVDRYYSFVENHLRERGIWEETLRKFPPNAIRAVVVRILQLFEDFYRDPETLDWGSTFEGLRDYERIADFIGALQTQGIVPVDKSELALEEAIRTVEEAGKRVSDAKTHEEMVDLAVKYEKAINELRKAKKAIKERDEEIKRLEEEAKKKPAIKIPPLTLAKPEAPADRVRRLTDVFIATLSKNNVPIRPEYRSRLRVELPSILTLASLEEQERAVELLAMEIVNEYKGKVEVARRAREIVPTAPPTVKEIPPEWKRTEGGWLLPNGRFIPFGKEKEEIEAPKVVPEPKLKPPAANLWRWLFDTFQIGAVEVWDESLGRYVKSFKSLEEVKRQFYALPKDEQDALISQYRAYLPAFRYPDMETFLKVKYDMSMEDLAKLSNEEKIKLWNEYWAEA